MWDERYSKEEFVYGKSANDFLQSSIKHISIGGRILSLAEGEGRNAVFLAKNNFKVTAVDSSSVGKAKALKLAKENQTSFHYDTDQLEDYDYGALQWDAVVSIFAHTSKDTQTSIFQNVTKSLKQNGVFILEGYNSKQLHNNTGGPKSEDMMFELDHILSYFKGFEILVAQNIQREIHEGIYHNGISDVVQFICRKV